MKETELKQIEENEIEKIAGIIAITEQIARDAHCGLPSPRMYAKDLYWHGYRKQSEGEWLSIKMPTGVEAFGIREVQVYPKCSLCGYMGDVSEWHFKFCPNCGAKMKGGAE